MIRKTFTLQGLTNEQDESLVERLLLTLNGVKEVEADSLQEILEVRYDEALVSPEQMRDLLDEYDLDLDL